MVTRPATLEHMISTPRSPMSTMATGDSHGMHLTALPTSETSLFWTSSANQEHDVSPSSLE